MYNTVLNILTNPIYAGAYAYGRTVTTTNVENGRKKVVRGTHVNQEDWQVLIKAHHENYISWEEYESNQKIITHNANMKGAMVRGSVGTSVINWITALWSLWTKNIVSL